MRVRRIIGIKWWPVFLAFFCLAGCAQDQQRYAFYERQGYSFPYAIGKPDRTWRLPALLVEISGLGFIDTQRLACVQDERGTVYVFNLQSGKIEREIPFGDPGDYEGMEIIGDDAWILKSDGTLIEVKGYLAAGTPVVNRYETMLSRRNDAEGLAWDAGRKGLLIACKEEPFPDGSKAEGVKAIYRFDLETLAMDEEPFLLIRQDSLNHYRALGSPAGGVKDAFSGPGDKTFKPSGLAIHPQTGELYVLGSAGKLLLVFSRENELNALIGLPPALFPQPEGICFSPEGELFIASEGRAGAAKIMHFSANR